MMNETIKHKGTWYIQEWDTGTEPTDPDEILKAYREGKGRKIDNVITNVGLIEMAKRNIGTSSSDNNKIFVGASATPTPMASQTALTTKTGERSVTSRTLQGTTERYLTTITRGHVGSNKWIGEMGLAASSILISRVIVNPRFQLAENKTYTLMSLMTHEAV